MEMNIDSRSRSFFKGDRLTTHGRQVNSRPMKSPIFCESQKQIGNPKTTKYEYEYRFTFTFNFFIRTSITLPSSTRNTPSTHTIHNATHVKLLPRHSPPSATSDSLFALSINKGKDLIRGKVFELVIISNSFLIAYSKLIGLQIVLKINGLSKNYYESLTCRSLPILQIISRLFSRLVKKLSKRSCWDLLLRSAVRKVFYSCERGSNKLFGYFLRGKVFELVIISNSFLIAYSKLIGLQIVLKINGLSKNYYESLTCRSLPKLQIISRLFSRLVKKLSKRSCWDLLS